MQKTRTVYQGVPKKIGRVLNKNTYHHICYSEAYYSLQWLKSQNESLATWSLDICNISVPSCTMLPESHYVCTSTTRMIVFGL